MTSLTILLPNQSRPLEFDLNSHDRQSFEGRIRPAIESACRKGDLITAYVPEIRHPLRIRVGTSDLKCFNEVVLAGDYDFELPESSPRVVIDGGANAGYASALFASRYPSADIIAVEPENSNFEMLCANTQAFPNVRAIRAAIWNRKAQMSVADKNVAHWGFRFEEARDGDKEAVESITMEEIMARGGRREIDLLKLDVEGAERELFSAGFESWLPRVRILLIEIHDDVPGCIEAFQNAIDKIGFRITRRKGQYASNFCLIREETRRAPDTRAPFA